MTSRKAVPAASVLGRRALNRALLARQMLLAREKTTALAAIERLVGMQAQVPRPPFGGLWTRVQKFERDDLIRLYREKKAVRATAMRGTIHLLSARDFLLLRPALAEMLAGGTQSVVGTRMSGVDIDALYERGRMFFSKGGAPFDEFRKAIEMEYPKLDVRAMAYAVRMGIPLVMVPADLPWGFSNNAGFILAEQWLGEKISVESPPLEKVVLRYLAAFGPATPADAQAWSGLRGLRDVFERLRPKLVSFIDEKKRELFDLPDAPRPDEDTPTPVRFLPEYDNILLAHADRARIASEEDRKRLTTPNLQILGSFLVDGFAAGSWKMDEKKKAAMLSLSPFARLPKKTFAELEKEGDAMLRFYAPGAQSYGVRIAE